MDFQRQPRIPGTRQVEGTWAVWGATVYKPAGYRQDQGYKIQDTGYRIQRHRDTETQTHRDRDTGYRIKQMPRSRVPL